MTTSDKPEGIAPATGNRRRVKIPLVVKLIGISTAIVVASTVAVTGLSAWFFSEDSRARAEDNALTLSQVVAAQMESEISAVYSGALSLFDVLRQSGGNRVIAQAAIASYLDRNPSIAYIGVPGERDIVNAKFFAANELDRTIVRPYLDSKKEIVNRAKEGETVVANASTALGIPAAILVVPYRDLGSRNAMIVLFSTESLQAIVQTGTANLTYVVGFDGELIAHPDFEQVKMGANYHGDELVSKLLASPLDNMQIRYKDAEGVPNLGAFRKLKIGQVSVTTSIPVSLVYEAALTVMRQNLYLGGVALLFSILAVYYFARSMTRPVMALVGASRKIEGGEFELDLVPTTRDELGLLTESFVQMGRGLAERERVKETFGKFVNREIAERALKGNLELGGTRKIATIMFSDIRSFTAISEKLAPEAVVEFLNEYMTRMVDCIEATGGVVDKFIGDAIMAVWGAPLSKGSPGEDALQAVRAMLMMRESLIEFNQGRGGPDKPLIRIGCGVNTGPCLAGQIGSLRRMEYTVIGDAVNLASRIEALNKPFGTDILVSQSTYELIETELRVEPMPAIKVKGKTGPLSIFAVIGSGDGAGPKDIDGLRELLGIPKPEGKVDVDKEETKYEIIGS
jgi:adenylate cyclase